MSGWFYCFDLKEFTVNKWRNPLLGGYGKPLHCSAFPMAEIRHLTSAPWPAQKRESVLQGEFHNQEESASMKIRVERINDLHRIFRGYKMNRPSFNEAWLALEGESFRR
ncbi:hypothetical protein KCP70_17475 [Salmonella enterica subsp. enterica]|nr:hypothetical protein KCP70_17475 [Salmonella enterica subsp. enterica]